MGNQDMSMNLKLLDLRLESLSVRDKSAEEKPGRRNHAEIIHFDEAEKVLQLKYKDKVIKNKVIYLELIGVLQVDADVSWDDIEKMLQSKRANDFVYPLLSESAHIISFVSSKTEMVPIILPPIMMRKGRADGKE